MFSRNKPVKFAARLSGPTPGREEALIDIAPAELSHLEISGARLTVRGGCTTSPKEWRYSRS